MEEKTKCLYLAAKPIVGGPDWCAFEGKWLEQGCPDDCKNRKPKEV